MRGVQRQVVGGVVVRISDSATALGAAALCVCPVPCLGWFVSHRLSPLGSGFVCSVPCFRIHPLPQEQFEIRDTVWSLVLGCLLRKKSAQGAQKVAPPAVELLRPSSFILKLDLVFVFWGMLLHVGFPVWCGPACSSIAIF